MFVLKAFKVTRPCTDILWPHLLRCGVAPPVYIPGIEPFFLVSQLLLFNSITIKKMITQEIHFHNTSAQYFLGNVIHISFSQTTYLFHCIVFLVAANDFVAKGLSYGKSVGHNFCEGKTADIDERHDFSSCVLLVSVMPSSFPIGLSIYHDRIPLLLRNVYI